MEKSETKTTSKKEKAIDNVRRLPEETIKALKSKYGEKRVKGLELPLDDLETEFLEVAVLIPSRATMGQFMRFSDTNPKKAGEILVNQCLLTNKEEVDADDALWNTCWSEISELIPLRKGRIKNL